jgi:hypothetical protein
MTAADAPPAPRPLRAARGPGLVVGRLLRLELRRSTMLLLLPLLGVLLAFTELRNDLSHAPLWPVRSVDVQAQVELTGAIVAGVAAWVAARDGRRHLIDLVMTTSRPRWVRQLAAWAALTAWAVLFYAACVAVVFGVTAGQATWGGPIWWLPGVGTAEIVAFSAVGFAFGAFFPSRFTAPLVWIVAAFAPQAGVLALQRHHPWGRVSPAQDATVPGTGIFFPFHAGVSIVQIIFLAGVAAVALGVLARPAAAGGRWLRRAGAMIALAGLAAAATGVTLADTARQEAQGVIIPALHNAGSGKPISYTPACDNSSAIAVCLHPAYRALLPAMADALGPVLSQVAGLPGAPVRVQPGTAAPEEISETINNSTPGPVISGNPPVLYLSPSLLAELPPNFTTTDFTRGLASQVAVTIIQAMMYGRTAPGRPGPGPAQHAIAAALAKAAGLPLVSQPTLEPGVPQQVGNGVPGPPPGSPAYVAAQRFAALPAAARHAWLAAHLAALRAGRISLAEIP